MHSDHTSAPDPTEPVGAEQLSAEPLSPEPGGAEGVGEADGDAVDSRPNRAARRGKHSGAAPGAPAHGPASHARGAQGRRINPVRRSG